jgi:hypothetical protein
MKDYLNSYNKVIIIANLLIVTISSVYHIFIICIFEFNLFFHSESLIFNICIVTLILYIRSNISSFSAIRFFISILYINLLLFVSLIAITQPIVDVLNYVILNDESFLEVQNLPIFHIFMDNLVKYVDCFGDDIPVQDGRLIEPIHNHITWAANADLVRSGLGGVGLGMTPIALMQFVAPMTLAKLPTIAKVGIVSFSAGLGLGVEVVSKWR